MGSWGLVTSSEQHTHSCMMSPAEIFCETSNHPGDSAPLQPTFGPLWLLAFPQTKTTIESKEISECQWDSEKYDRAAHGDWENCVRSQGAYSEGDWGVIVLCTMFLVFCIFFSKCLYFSYYMARYFLDRPCCIYLCTYIHLLHIYTHRNICISKEFSWKIYLWDNYLILIFFPI